MRDIPKIISVNGHVIEPAGVWQSRLPVKYRGRGPRLVRVFGRIEPHGAGCRVVEDPDAPDARWADEWRYDDLRHVIPAGMAQVHDLREQHYHEPVTHDEMAPGCHDQGARLADMDLNHVEASLCFPTFPRFCGQTFLEREDKDLAELCVKAYNDRMIDEWCAGAGAGRLLPLTLIPPVGRRSGRRRGAPLRGQGLPRDRLLRVPAPPRPAEHPLGLLGPGVAGLRGDRDGGQHTHRLVVHLAQHRAGLPRPGPQVAQLPERAERLRRLTRLRSAGTLQNGPMPTWSRTFSPARSSKTQPKTRPSMWLIMFETDCPHGDTSFPHSKRMAEKLIKEASLSDQEGYAPLRGNAISCYGLERFGITR